MSAVQIRENLVGHKRQREEGRGVLDVLGADRRDAGQHQVPHAAQAAAAVVRRGLRRGRILYTHQTYPSAGTYVLGNQTRRQTETVLTVYVITNVNIKLAFR